MKVIAGAIGLILAFWAGYGLASYRAYSQAFPVHMRLEQLSNASLFMRSVGLLDQGETAPLQAKLLGVVKLAISNPPPPIQFSWRDFLYGPFDDTPAVVASMRQETDTRAATIRADLELICQQAPATDSYRFICRR